MKTCAYCKNEFEPKKPKAIYCSTKCRTYAHRSKQVEKAVKKVMDDPKNKKEFKKSTDSLIETGFAATETSIKKGKITIKDQSEPKPGSLAHYIKYGN